MSSKSNKVLDDLLFKKELFAFINRPWSLFEGSISSDALHSKPGRELLSAVNDIFIIERSKGVFGIFFISEQFRHYCQVFSDYANKLSFSKKILREGLALNQKARRFLEGRDRVGDVRETIDLWNELHVKATVFPGLLFNQLPSDLKDKELLELCKNLRSVSYYPEVLQKLIVPQLVKNLNLPEDDLIQFLTISEALAGDLSQLEVRRKAREKGMTYIHYRSAAGEQVFLVPNNKEIISRLEMKVLFEEVKEIKGQIACLGKIVGKAKVILSNKEKELQKINFAEGDVLISIQCSPVLLPFIKKCSAIISDEGGIACHAAILAREFNKPCVMGTKYATQVIKDGDLIEVDADNGIVRILS